jgi:pyridoxal phosphate enzyme (YggS family)
MQKDLVDGIKERYEKTLDQIGKAAQNAGRKADNVRLLVVTKAQPMDVIEATLQAGIRELGENYPEEAVEKILRFRDLYPDACWHMIGHLQSRKAKLIAENFNYLHSLDSVGLAEKVDRRLSEFGKTLPVLLEFNVGGEESKSGWNASDETRWEEFLPQIKSVLQCKQLVVKGLMTMPPLLDPPEQTRPYFRKLRCLRNFLHEQFPQSEWAELSMGTSADFQIAVEEGATMVRVGRAIVGERPVKA